MFAPAVPRGTLGVFFHDTRIGTIPSAPPARHRPAAADGRRFRRSFCTGAAGRRRKGRAVSVILSQNRQNGQYLKKMKRSIKARCRKPFSCFTGDSAFRACDPARAPASDPDFAFSQRKKRPRTDGNDPSSGAALCLLRSAERAGYFLFLTRSSKFVLSSARSSRQCCQLTGIAVARI